MSAPRAKIKPPEHVKLCAFEYAKVIWVQVLEVDAKHRRKGLGSATLLAVKQYAFDRAKSVRLTPVPRTDKDGPALQRFYERAGFKLLPDGDMEWSTR